MSIFDDRQSMIEVWKQLREEMRQHEEDTLNAAERINNLSVAILPVYFVGLGLIFSMLTGMIQTMFLFSLGFFPLILVALAIMGKRSLRRKYRTRIYHFTQIRKVEMMLGLHESISGRLEGQPFHKDITLFSPLYIPKMESSWEFAEKVLSGEFESEIFPEISGGYSVFIVFGSILTIVNFIIWGILFLSL